MQFVDCFIFGFKINSKKKILGSQKAQYSASFHSHFLSFQTHLKNKNIIKNKNKNKNKKVKVFSVKLHVWQHSPRSTK